MQMYRWNGMSCRETDTPERAAANAIQKQRGANSIVSMINHDHYQNMQKERAKIGQPFIYQARFS
ncbi:MAG: hypothetical protein ACLT90_16055 [Enterococcus raffinosus]